MGTVFYECGCWITTSMFGPNEVVSIGYCMAHSRSPVHLECLKRMAEDIYKQQNLEEVEK